MTARPAVIGVIDLRDGLAVHATGGDRRGYLPVTSVAGRPTSPGDAGAVAQYYADTCGTNSIYVADLDAIRGEDWQSTVIERVAAHTRDLWLDAGITTPAAAERARTSGATRIIVGLETLDSFASLAAICRQAGPDAVAFSLDVRDGQLLTRGSVAVRTAEEAAHAAADAGAAAIIVLDLALVGSRRGPAFDAIARVRRAAPGVWLLAGGGVRDEEDLRRLGGLGCDAVLVATALLNGSLRA